MFSEEILVGETLQAFKPSNVILIGPQGCGKSMILNLIRTKVLSEWFTGAESPPKALRTCPPYMGISINLVRTAFHTFGRRSVSRAMSGQADPSLDAMCAADFLTHFLFREFLTGIQFLQQADSAAMCAWMGIPPRLLRNEQKLVKLFRGWGRWYDYYRQARTLRALLRTALGRLDTWRQFLNTDIDKIPRSIWASKESPEHPLSEMGALLAHISSKELRLFVVLDQYEVLSELNAVHGTALQRVVNTLIKARDPYVFHKLGARTHDWGRELRIWGAESRIEEHRDYSLINLTDLLMRDEDGRRWLFPKFALDVTYKRLQAKGYSNLQQNQVSSILGGWSRDVEATHYFSVIKRRDTLALKGVPEVIRRRLAKLVDRDSSGVELRLAGAWVLQRVARGEPRKRIEKNIDSRPWLRWSWKKERVDVALLQLASMANQKKKYFGWEPTLYLSGGNISALLLLLGEMWDVACRRGEHPVESRPISPLVQTSGIAMASEKWFNRDRNENTGGSMRYAFLSRIGPAVCNYLKSDLAISNPGFTGFSLRESDLRVSEKGVRALRFLEDGVNWAIFEERAHTSKLQESARRRKFFLHPLLCAYFNIPYKRIKEPRYVSVDELHDWIFCNAKITFGGARRPASQVRPLQEDDARQLRLFE